MAIAFISTAWLPTKVWGLVPAAIKLSGADGPAWLLIFRLPGELQWPVIIGAIALGLAMYATAARLGWSIRQSRLARERSRGGRGPVPPLQRQNVV
jgi:hypothetical protein